MSDDQPIDLDRVDDAKLRQIKDAVESEINARDNRARLATSINANVHDLIGAGVGADDIRGLVEAALFKEAK